MDVVKTTPIWVYVLRNRDSMPLRPLGSHRRANSTAVVQGPFTMSVYPGSITEWWQIWWGTPGAIDSPASAMVNYRYDAELF